MNTRDQRSLASFAASPRNWPLLLGLGLLRLLVLLPFRIQLLLGKFLGFLIYRLTPRRRHIARVNLEICFPELDEKRREKVLREHFASLGMGLFEMGLAWWASDASLARLIHIDGMENMLEPLAAGHGVVLLSGHFTGIEITGRGTRLLLPAEYDMAAMYRANKNQLLDEILRRIRSRSTHWLIPKDDMRQTIRLLRKGKVPLWYAADQSYRHKYHELVNFFGEPAMTNAALTHIARITKAKVVPYLPRRRADGRGYHVDVLPALENFPSADAAADALRINRLLEEHIKRAPEQYYWVHRRFKDRPPPHPNPYVAVDSLSR